MKQNIRRITLIFFITPEEEAIFIPTSTFCVTEQQLPTNQVLFRLKRKIRIGILSMTPGGRFDEDKEIPLDNGY